MGLGANGEAPLVRESSQRLGHTGRAQPAAPRGIVLEDLQIEADLRIPLYLGPGVTGVEVRHCVFTGSSASVALYLDAESARNTIENCTFDVRAGREVLAVDGSADNTIVGNRFARAAYGGIYLYRNCGEGGLCGTRHRGKTGSKGTSLTSQVCGRQATVCGWAPGRGGNPIVRRMRATILEAASITATLPTTTPWRTISSNHRPRRRSGMTAPETTSEYTQQSFLIPD